MLQTISNHNPENFPQTKKSRHLRSDFSCSYFSKIYRSYRNIKSNAYPFNESTKKECIDSSNLNQNNRNDHKHSYAKYRGSPMKMLKYKFIENSSKYTPNWHYTYQQTLSKRFMKGNVILSSKNINVDRWYLTQTITKHNCWHGYDCTHQDLLK